MKILDKEVQEITKGTEGDTYDVRIGNNKGERGTLEMNKEAYDRLVSHTSFFFITVPWKKDRWEKDE